MPLTVSELTALFDGTLLSGRGDTVFTQCQSLAAAGPDDLSFFGNGKYLPALRATRAAVVLVPNAVPEGFASLFPHTSLVAVDNPSLVFAQVMSRLAPPPAPFIPGIHPSAVVDPSAILDPKFVCIGPHAVIEAGVTIGNGTRIGAGCVLGDGVVIGQDCVLHPRVTVLRHCRLGHRVILHPGAVIGADGFVVLEDDVEIGANSCVDRARFGQTRIGAGTKIDNLVQIAHNVDIGKNCVVAGLSGIAGSARLHDGVTIAAQVGVAGHIEIGSGVIITGQSGVAKSMMQPGVYMGDRAEPIRKMLRIMAAVHQLPELVQRLRSLEKKSAAPAAPSSQP
jgi:UDP-3-O-[3-hydroxymyristoyl] glucosamine N-acyltransferase